MATLSACVAARLQGVYGSYFHDLGWRTTLHDLVQSAWLARNNSVSLGGNYGEPTPPGTTAVPAQMWQGRAPMLVSSEPSPRADAAGLRPAPKHIKAGCVVTYVGS